MLSQDTSRLGDHMYFIGDPKLSSPLVKGKVVYLPCPDNYESENASERGAPSEKPDNRITP